MKFSYCRSVRSSPIGLPEQTIVPWRTCHVLSWVLLFTHPARSLPLKSGREPSHSRSLGGVAASQTTVKGKTSAFVRVPFMVAPCKRGQGEATGHDREGNPEAKRPSVPWSSFS